MKHGRSLAVRLTGFLLIMLMPVLAFANIEGMASPDKEAVMKKVSGLQMPFIENQGQIKDKSVRFYANTFAGTVFVTDRCEIVYILQKAENKKERARSKDKRRTDSGSENNLKGHSYQRESSMRRTGRDKGH